MTTFTLKILSRILITLLNYVVLRDVGNLYALCQKPYKLVCVMSRILLSWTFREWGRCPH